MHVSARSVLGLLSANERLLHFCCGAGACSCIVPIDEEGWVDKWTHFALAKSHSEDKTELYMAI